MVVPGLEALEVCMVTTNAAADAHVSARPSEGEKNELPVTISFYVTPKQALILAELEQSSVIHLAFVARGESTAAYISKRARCCWWERRRTDDHRHMGATRRQRARSATRWAFSFQDGASAS